MVFKQNRLLQVNLDAKTEFSQVDQKAFSPKFLNIEFQAISRRIGISETL